MTDRSDLEIGAGMVATFKSGELAQDLQARVSLAPQADNRPARCSSRVLRSLYQAAPDLIQYSFLDFRQLAL